MSKIIGKPKNVYKNKLINQINSYEKYIYIILYKRIFNSSCSGFTTSYII